MHVVSVYIVSVLYCLMRKLVRGIERWRLREREGVRCQHKATTACSPAEGVGTMLLFKGRVVSDCDSSSSLSLVTPPLPSLSLLPPISSPQREKRWSISSAGGERNSSSVSRGVSGRESEG